MRWLKRDRRKAGIALAGLLPLLALWMWLMVLVVWAPVSAAGTYERASGFAGPGIVTLQTPSTVDLTATAVALDIQKQNDEKLQRDNSGIWPWLNPMGGSIGTILLAFAAIIGTIFGFTQWRGNQEEERRKRDEDRLQKAVEGLGSGRLSAKLGAAVMLRTFLLPNYERFYRQVFGLAVTQLRPQKEVLDTLEPPDALRQEIAQLFSEAFPLARNVLKQKSQFDPFRLDASGVLLDNVYLSRTDLEGIRMREAYLRGTHFWQTNLSGAYLKWSDLRGAYFVEAHLEKADLGQVNLAGADLRKAYLAGALLGNADLTGADLAGTDLTGANLTNTRPQDAKSLTNAIMRDVIGLDQTQKNACAAAGAIIDNSSQPSSPGRSSSSLPSPPSQSNNPQAPSAAAQLSTPPPSTDGSSATSSQSNAES